MKRERKIEASPSPNQLWEISNLALAIEIDRVQRSGHWPERLKELMNEYNRRREERSGSGNAQGQEIRPYENPDDIYHHGERIKRR